MALPDNKLSTYEADEEFLPPDDLPYMPLNVSELGGVDLQNTSQGLVSNIWTLRYDMFTRGLILETRGKYYEVIKDIEVPDSIDLAFDQNMNYAVCWSFGNTIQLRWFNPQVINFVTDTFTGVRDGHLTLDDKRIEFTNTSDIIFGYIKENGDLCYRQQRDRFTVERVLKQNIPPECTLEKIGMTTGNRLKFKISVHKSIPECEVTP